MASAWCHAVFAPFNYYVVPCIEWGYYCCACAVPGVPQFHLMQWSVGTILMGLYSFMLEESPTYGSMTSTDAFKRKCARESLAFNVKNK